MPRLDTKKKPANAIFFVAMAAIAAFAFNYIIREGQRIKQENELLSYEVW